MWKWIRIGDDLVVKRVGIGGWTPFAIAWLCLLAFALGGAPTGQALAATDEITVRAAVDRQEVSKGETFVFQIEVNGHDAPAEPDLSGLVDFQVEPRGGQQNSGTSISIINGQVSKVVRKGYVFQYGLTPRKEGLLRIPALAVKMGGQTYETEPVDIMVRKPVESKDLRLRLDLAKTECYVGEPVELAVTWYIGKSIKGFQFTLPVLDDPVFGATVATEELPAGQQELAVIIPLGRTKVAARKDRGVLDGQEYTTVSFRLSLAPRKAGELLLPQATVQCQALSGFRQRGGRDPHGMFDNNDFFHDFFNQGRQEVYQTLVAPSNQPTLTVLPLPETGRPAIFTGLVGEYGIAVQASPTEVNVGAPITLTIQVAGPSAVKNTEIPTFKDNPLLIRDFKIPEEMAAGETANGITTFTQTIRASHAQVREIPALELAYFNPKSKTYALARSQPIALVVRPTREVRIEDVEGGSGSPAQAEKKTEIAALEGGIAHNYEGPDALRGQAIRAEDWPNSSGWLALLILPPFCYVLFLGGMIFMRSRRRDPAGQAARKAYEEFLRDLKVMEKGVPEGSAVFYARLAEAMRAYLGKRLHRPSAALVYGDVEGLLRDRGVSRETLAALQDLLARCEAHCYAGGVVGEGSDFLAELALARTVVADIEGRLR